MKPIGSIYNQAVTETFDFAPDPYLVDSTIRSLQSGVSGSQHSLDDLVAIGKAVDSLGVREQIINVSWRDGAEAIRGLREAGVRCRLVATFRARNPQAPAWMRAAAGAGANEVSLESAHDPDHLRALAREATSLGLDVSHGFAEEYSHDDVVALVKAGLDLDCKSQSFHDSFFHLAIGPEAIRHFIRAIRADVPQHPPLYVHLSNFFGHATMTAIAAMSAGASAADVCLNATGHHCGHTSLGEVALGLRALYGIDCGITTANLAEAAAIVERRTRIPRRLDQPIVGPYAFLGDGAYWAAEAAVPFAERIHATFPIPPQLVGASERVVWSDRTATVESIRIRAKQQGVDFLSDDDCERVISTLREVVDGKADYPGWLDDSEFDGLLKQAGYGSPTTQGRA